MDNQLLPARQGQGLQQWEQMPLSLARAAPVVVHLGDARASALTRHVHRVRVFHALDAAVRVPAARRDEPTRVRISWPLPGTLLGRVNLIRTPVYRSLLNGWGGLLVPTCGDEG